MAHLSLENCLIDLEKNGHLIRIREEVDPDLEMAAIHLRIHEKSGPAILFENVKGCRYRCVSNLFGTKERCEFIFRHTIGSVKKMIEVKNNPLSSLKNPFRLIETGWAAVKALPKHVTLPSDFEEISISDLPMIRHWPNDGGAFVTLPQVYTEDQDKKGVMNSNLGMYRIQLNGNDYLLNQEIGLHYQLHRGIGVHQTVAAAKGEKLKVSVFIGGPPAHTFSAVMPLPESLSELTFAGLLAGRRFRYSYVDGFCVSVDADFVIMGEVENGVNKPEGPFGDHLGYYSLKHDFPVMKVHKVLARKNAIWPFTVVGRPPQEDTTFGKMIHELTGNAIRHELPGVKAVHAVDAAGVHPLLLAVGSERYTPYSNIKIPSELITQANHILGTGQLSLAKFLFIAASSSETPHPHHEQDFFKYIFERIDFNRDVHFHTNTSIDTLDYSGTGLNSGSKVAFTVCGDKKRELAKIISPEFNQLFRSAMIFDGVVAVEFNRFFDYTSAKEEIKKFSILVQEKKELTEGIALLVITDDCQFVAENMQNFLWVTFTRSNPSHDIYGLKEHFEFKHWSCEAPIIIDARSKPHHAPILYKNSEIEKRIDKFFQKGAPLVAFQ